MSDKLKRALIGALVTVALAAAVSYGLISQQTADTIQGEANKTLADNPPAQSTPPAPQPQAQTPTQPSAPSPTPAGPQDGAPRP